MRKKFGFKDYIRTSLPLKTIEIIYEPLTRKTFTDLSQIKKGMKLVCYNSRYGVLLSRRSDNPTILIVEKDFNPITDLYCSTKTITGVRWYLNKQEIFFYEEEKKLGRVE